MGSYASVAIRDTSGNIVGYRSTSTGEVTEGSAAPSAAFTSLQQQYEARVGRVVTTGPEHTYYQGIATNTTAGEGGFSGRAAVYAATWTPLQQSRASVELANQPAISTVPTRDLSSNAPTRAEVLFPQNNYERQAIQNVQSRPGYTPSSSLGDTRTQFAIKSLETFRSMGIPVATADQMTGRVLEYQRQQALATPTTKDERYYGNELQKWAENKVELSSAYHDVGMKAGVPIPANRFEYQGDLAVEFLKGRPTKASEMFSPVSGEMSEKLPAGEGVQQFAWREAVATDKGLVQPKSVSFMEAVEYLGAAEGKYGPYGFLSGGIPDTTAISQNISGSKTLGSEGAVSANGELPKWEDYKSKLSPSQQATIQWGLDVSAEEARKLFTPTTVETIQPTGELPIIGTALAPIVAPFQPTTVVTKTGYGEVRESGETPFATFVTKTNKDISTGLGFDKLPSPTTEQIKQIAPFLTAFGQAPVAMALSTPIIGDYTAAYLKGETTAMRTKPVETALSFGMGAAMGVAFKGAEVGMGAARLSVAEKAISQGGFYRGAEIFSAKALPVAGAALGGLYAVDVGMRSTQTGRDLTPVSAERFGGIVATEARPMLFGTIAGYGAPSAISKEVRLSDIGYKSALQEGRTAGRLGYYVTEPITSPAKVAFKSTSEFISTTRAAGGSPVGEALQIAKFEAASTLQGQSGYSSSLVRAGNNQQRLYKTIHIRKGTNIPRTYKQSIKSIIRIFGIICASISKTTKHIRCEDPTRDHI